MAPVIPATPSERTLATRLKYRGRNLTAVRVTGAWLLSQWERGRVSGSLLHILSLDPTYTGKPVRCKELALGRRVRPRLG